MCKIVQDYLFLNSNFTNLNGTPCVCAMLLNLSCPDLQNNQLRALQKTVQFLKYSVEIVITFT